MKRWTFRILAAVSLLLWLAIAVTWPMSYWWTVLYILNRYPEPTSISLDSGRIWWSRGGLGTPTDTGVRIEPNTASSGRSIFSLSFHTNDFRLLGFEHEKLNETIIFGTLNNRQMIPTTLHAVALPLWFLLVLFSWPILPWIRSRRRAAMPEHHCGQCGYDLRATPDRCPECGTAAARE